jgi:Ran GTPase-activating protein (RanGAP) involved in mRNA processing and transport
VTVTSIPSLHSLVLNDGTLGSVGLTELAPALYHTASILRDILRCNKTMTTLDLSGNIFGLTTGAVECIAGGLGSNSTLLKIDLSSCALFDVGLSIMDQTLGSRNTTPQKLALGGNFITSMGVGVLLETMERSSHHITDLDLQRNSIGNEGASLVGSKSSS